MRGSTNRSSCEATMASSSALAVMSFIVIHGILMKEKKHRMFSSGTVMIVFVFWIP
jgi:hypothetical protein